jgi:hypothetical protein
MHMRSRQQPTQPKNATLIKLARPLDQGRQSTASDPPLRSAALCPMLSSTYHVPCTVGDYTEFYSSRGHTTYVGINVPQWGRSAAAKLSAPIGYHSRSGSINIGGCPSSLGAAAGRNAPGGVRACWPTFRRHAMLIECVALRQQLLTTGIKK